MVVGVHSDEAIAAQKGQSTVCTFEVTAIWPTKPLHRRGVGHACLVSTALLSTVYCIYTPVVVIVGRYSYPQKGMREKTDGMVCES